MPGFVVTGFETYAGVEAGGCSLSDLSDNSSTSWVFNKDTVSKIGSGFWFKVSGESATSTGAEAVDGSRTVGFSSDIFRVLSGFKGFRESEGRADIGTSSTVSKEGRRLGHTGEGPATSSWSSLAALFKARFPGGFEVEECRVNVETASVVSGLFFALEAS